MKRGEVWWVDFNPSIGGKIQKIRPAVIISHDASNKVLNRVQVVPVTSKTAKCFPCEAYIEVDRKISKAMADQLTTVSKQRFKTRIGKISEGNMIDLEHAIRIQLDL